MVLFFSSNAEGSTLVIDSNEKTQKIPAKFRQYEELRISGSEQFSGPELDAIVQKLGEKELYIVDLREECHGFVNDLAISWYGKANAENVGRTLLQIENLEKIRLDTIVNQKKIIASQIMEKTQGVIQKIMEIPLFVQTAYTEKDLCTIRGIHYMRFPISDHRTPRSENLDAFLTQFKNLPKEGKLHFHCRGGRGRTCLLFTMMDMMHHAKSQSFEEILNRQKEIGGYDFLYPLPANNWKYNFRMERIDFLQKFYQYCKEQSPEFSLFWSQWNH